MKNTDRIETRINLMKEQGIPHPPHEYEQEFYRLVVSGDSDGIMRLREQYPAQSAGETEKGRLSDDPIRNEIYHLVANCTIITRKCISAGMPQEDAYSLSDMFIRTADRCRSVEDVGAVNDQLALEFAKRMKKVRSREVSPVVRRAIGYISDNLHTRLTAEGIAQRLGYDRSYISVVFKRETGQTITGFILARRIEAAKNLISGGVPLTDIAQLLGFSSQSHFCRRFREVVGMTPGEYRDSVGVGRGQV